MAIMVTCWAMAGRTLWLRRELNGAGRRCLEKQRKKKERRESTSSLIGERRAAVKGALDTPRWCGHVEAGGAPTGMHRSQWKLAVGESWPAFHCSSYLPNCHLFYFSIYSQIYMVTQKSPKIKVASNPKFYNFALITILKLCLYFKMQV